LDLADSGFKVYLVEKNSSIGGAMAQLDKTFPTNDCAMCIMAPKLVATGRHPNITLITNAEIEEIKGEVGDFYVAVKKKPRYVDEDKCTGCGLCMENCPVRKEIYKIEEEVPEIEEEKMKKVKEIIEKYSKEEGILSVLQEVNNEYKYLPKEVIEYISKEVQIPVSRLYSMISFYDGFSIEEPKKYEIKICNGTSCYVGKSSKIIERFTEKLPPMRGVFSLKVVKCLGLCGIGPIVMVNEKVYEKVKEEDVDKILNEYGGKDE